MHKTLNSFLDFFFPLNCSFCGRYDFFSGKISICKNCIQEREQFSSFESENNLQICLRCSSTMVSKDCEYCNSRNVFFSKLNFIRVKGELERKIIHKIKFSNNPHLSQYFRLGLKRYLPKLENRDYSAIISIPSNKKTMRERPIPVCKPVIDLIRKKTNLKLIYPIQKKSRDLQSGKSFRDRFLHAQSAFAVKKSFQNSLVGNYLLVDDVFTTGATINEISKLLLMNGAKEVDVLVLVKGKS